MSSLPVVMQKLLNIEDTVVESAELGISPYDDSQALYVHVHPYKRAQCRCPICGAKCIKNGISKRGKLWRSLDFGGNMVYLVGDTQRIKCPIHGTLVATVPWAYPDSEFTKDFDMEATWLATQLSKKAVAGYMRIDWETVGRCIERTLNELEPDRSVRLEGLKYIGIDETSYKKGHRYILTVLNQETNTVVWAHEGTGKEVLEQFFALLTQEQKDAIEGISGDGARWITECAKEHCPNAIRCLDPFHVVKWATEAVDEVRTDIYKEYYGIAAKLNKEAMEVEENNKKNKDEKSEEQLNDEAVKAKQLKEEAHAAKEIGKKIKKAIYSLGKNPDNLTVNQQDVLDMIAETSPDLFRAYRLKESLRLLLKLKDVDVVEQELNTWCFWASHSQLEPFKKLYEKIKRNKEYILNTISLGLSNARLEANNNKVQLIIRKAYGFRDVSNLISMVYLVCSDLKVTLPNRYVVANA